MILVWTGFLFMTMHDFEIVSLRRALAQSQLLAGAVGCVVQVHEDGQSCEVEFCDDDGVRLALLTLREEDLESLSHPEDGEAKAAKPSSKS